MRLLIILLKRQSSQFQHFKMKMRYIQFVVILQFLSIGFCANILLADVVPSPSHQIFNYAIAEALLERGHNITVLGPPSSRTVVHKNFHHLSLGDLFTPVMQDFDSQSFLDMYKFQVVQFMHDYSISACKHALQSNGFKTLMDYPKDFKFDIILIDLTIGGCFLPLIQRFNYAPAVGITAFLIPVYLSYDFGNELHLSYIPTFYTYSTDMNFFQRLDNYVVAYMHIVLKEIYLNVHLNKLLKEAFHDPIKSVSDLERHVSLLLVNWDPVLNHPQGITPNMIPIGGSHIKPKKLPKDIQTIMDKAPNGVILFSLGSNIRSNEFTGYQRNIIINTFSKLKETILWKFDANITGLSENVVVRKWLPQTEILAHPNTKLFISHSGGLSTAEASHFGVPVLGMPFFLDQHINIDNLVRKEVARKLYFADLTEENFLENINEVLHNKKYKTNMKELSRKIRDQPQTPMDRAVFWIEYAMRYNGTHFLNPKSRVLPLFITSSTDVHLFIVFVICVLLYILKIIYNITNKKTVVTISKSKNE